jgi:BlaR1 peptidase M56
LLGTLSDDALRDILMHEIAHLARGDHWVVLLEELAAALYWPIVSVHALNRELRRAREEVCDNFVLVRRDPILYGETLLHVAGLLMASRPIAATAGILGEAGELERRIVQFVDPHRNTATATSRATALAVRFAFLASVLVLAATRLATSAAPGTRPPLLTTPTESAADPKRPGHFRGRVTDLDDKPVKAAHLYVLAWSEQLDRGITPLDAGALPIRATTDGDGRFDFDAPEAVFTDVDGLPAQNKCLVIASADGYGPDWQRIADRGSDWGEWHTSDIGGSHDIRALPAADPIDLALELAPDDARIRGRLLDPDGRPLSGARVLVEELKIPVGQSLAAYIGHATDPEGGRRGWMDFARFITAVTPLPGMTAETRTDADGRFTLTGLGRERLATLKVTAPSVANTVVTVMTRNAPDVGTNRVDGEPRAVAHGAEFTLELKPGVTISGVVRDRDTKQPLAGMWVGWDGLGLPAGPDIVEGLWSGTYPRTTDANGRFTISGIWPAAFDGPDAQPGSADSSHDVMVISPPGMLYQTAAVNAKRDEEVVVECARGIPFRLKLVDEQGQPVVADVTHCDISPNPRTPNPFVWRVYYEPWISRAAHRGDGIYEGFVLPGPGAVVASIPGRGGYRPAHVDPKAFFAPGRTEWTEFDENNSYGTQDTLASAQHWHNQHDYVAIVLINPAPDSGPLELSATVFKDKPRQVTLVDPDGEPVVGVRATEGYGWHESGPPFRSATFFLSGLNPDRPRRITFIEEQRKLIGVLLARSDGEAPYTVVMQPWGTVTRRILNQDGKPSWANLTQPVNDKLETNAGAQQGTHASAVIDDDGRFRIDQLMPGQRYTLDAYIGPFVRGYSGAVFENLVVSPGEVRDLGDVQPPATFDQRKK